MEYIELAGAAGVLGWMIYLARLVIRYQRDFADRASAERDRLDEKIIGMNARHAEEIGLLTGRVKTIEDEREQLRTDLLDCTRKLGGFVAVLEEHGWSPDDQ